MLKLTIDYYDQYIPPKTGMTLMKREDNTDSVPNSGY